MRATWGPPSTRYGPVCVSTRGDDCCGVVFPIHAPVELGDAVWYKSQEWEVDNITPQSAPSEHSFPCLKLRRTPAQRTASQCINPCLFGLVCFRKTEYPGGGHCRFLTGTSSIASSYFPQLSVRTFDIPIGGNVRALRGWVGKIGFHRKEARSVYTPKHEPFQVMKDEGHLI